MVIKQHQWNYTKRYNMVNKKDLNRFTSEVMELFGFLMSQEIAKSELTPRDTTRMARSFPASYKFSKNSINWTTPYYTEFVNNGTSRMRARRFIQKNFHQKGETLLKKAFQITDKKYR